MLELKNVSYQLGPNSLIEDFDLEVKAGENLAVLGPNGAGKTTLLKLAAGLKKPNSGKILWENENLYTSRPRIGYLGHDLYLYEDLTLQQNLNFFASLYQVERGRKEIFAWLKNLGLELYAGDKVENLSRGLKQRLAICRCFFIAPQLILLDEPYTGLDPAARQIIQGLLQEYSHCPVIFTSHDIERALNNCRRWILLKQGRAAGRGDADEQQKLYEAYACNKSRVSET